MLLNNSHSKYETANTGHYLQHFLEKNEKMVVIVLCMIALARIFFFSAAFPFFNNVDEQYHFDAVVKHAHGYLPHKENDFFDLETTDFLVHNSSPEYFGGFSLASRLPDDPADKGAWLIIKNREAFSPPVYYMMAGGWYKLGELIGFQGGYLLYWIRFMNIPVMFLLLCLAYYYCRYIEPPNFNLRIGVVVLLSFFPQDVFYSINSDVLSPLSFIGGLFVITILFKENEHFWLYPLAGLAIASTFLIKLSNIPALFVLSFMLLLLGKKYFSAHQVAKYAPRFLVMLAAAAIPIIVWGSLNYHNLGDLTGSSEKIKNLGWTAKSFGEMWDHPIFTPHGIIEFSSRLTESFWRGEFIWHGKKLATETADAMYVVTTLIFIIAGLISIFSKNGSLSFNNKIFNYFHVLILLAYISFLALLSMHYDFGKCFYPSNEYPYFTSGRLMLASLVSFLIIYVKGIEYLSAKVSKHIDPMVIIILVVFYSTYSEIMSVLANGVFSSPYNFFHL
jgi:hypothetical protein